MRKLLKRFAAAASAVVIGGVSCVTTWFSVPVSAAAGVGWLEWLEFQSLLQGIGVGGNNSDFADSVQDWIDGIGGAEMPREDYDGEWMTNYEYYNRVGWDEIIDWFDGLFSGDNAYTDIADVGADVSGGVSGSFPDAAISDDGYLFRFSWKSGNYIYGDYSIKLSDSSDDFLNDCYFVYAKNNYGDYDYMFIVDGSSVVPGYMLSCPDWHHVEPMTKSDWSHGNFYAYHLLSSSQISKWQNFLSHFSMPLLQYDGYYWDLFSKIDSINFNSVGAGSDGFIGPVYTYPAAQELYKSTGTAAGIRLDVQTKNGVPDVQAALDGAGVKTVDDLVAGVAAGTVPMSKVFVDAKVTPYVVADTTSGTVVTDLGVSATAAGVKSVGLTQDLAVPKDLTAAATYSIKGKTWDPEMSKYKLPLFEYFPFCLPWDIYQVLAAFSADPVAPVFDVPVGKILSGVRSADVSKAASVSAKIDFGDNNWSKVFEIIRILECAGIIVGLCLVAVYLIHGGR